MVDVRFPNFDVEVIFLTVDFKLDTDGPSSESELGWNIMMGVQVSLDVT